MTATTRKTRPACGHPRKAPSRPRPHRQLQLARSSLRTSGAEAAHAKPQSVKTQAVLRFAVAALLALVLVPATPRATASAPAANSYVPEGTPGGHQALATPQRLPLTFEPNVGQFDEPVKFAARHGGPTVFFTQDEIVFAYPDAATDPDIIDPEGRLGLNVDKSRKDHPPTVRFRLRNANPKAVIEGQDSQVGTSNYFVGNDPARWRAGVANYSRVTYRDIYPATDLTFYANSEGRLEYDFVVRPGGDPDSIRLDISPSDGVGIDEGGNLRIATSLGDVGWQAPATYQGFHSGSSRIESRYEIGPDRSIGFVTGQFDRSRDLIIDPVSLVYSTFLGGNGDDYAYGVAVDSSGAAYATGETASSSFPTASPYQASRRGATDAFVTKFAPGGSLAYSTYLGGTSQQWGFAVAVDSLGSAYVGGQTNSSNFPTQSAFQGTYSGGTDAFVAKLSPAGDSLVYSSFLGASGTDKIKGIALDSLGAAYVTGQTNSINFPMVSALQPIYGGSFDAFISKIAPSGSSLSYSTYLGGTSQEYGTGIDVDGTGAAYITGWTQSSNFPTVSPYQGSFGGGNQDVYVAKVAAGGGSLAYSTYLGGSVDDTGAGIAVTSGGNAIVTGSTNSANFPTLLSYQSSLAGSSDGFITKFGSTGTTLSYSTYFGGSSGDYFGGVAVDSTGAVYATGNTASTNFPTSEPYQGSNAGLNDAVAIRLASNGYPSYSTYIGGSQNDVAYDVAVDSSGAAYLAGHTGSSNYPTLAPAQLANASPNDGFLTKIEPPAASTSYLAEGASTGGFQTWVLLANPSTTEATDARLTFFTSTGPVPGPVVQVPKMSRRSILVNSYVSTYDVSTKVEGLRGPVVAERAVYSTNVGHEGAHLGKAIGFSAYDWFLAEGSSGPGFETWVLVANPNMSVTATVDVTYLTGTGPLTIPSFSVAPGSRKSVKVNDTISTFDVATKVHSTGAMVVAERATYVHSGTYHGATDSPGNAFPASSWTLSEGSTGPGFDEWILVANPDPFLTPTVTVQFLSSGGVVASTTFPLPPSTRKSIKANNYVTNWDVATRVISTGGAVVAERAMYTTSSSPYGLTSATGEGTWVTSTAWLLAEGASTGGFDTWIAVTNPSTSITATASVTFLTGSGPVYGPTFPLPPLSRKSVRVANYVATYDVSTEVTSTSTGIVADHSVYTPAGANHDSTSGPGVPLT